MKSLMIQNCKVLTLDITFELTVPNATFQYLHVRNVEKLIITATHNGTETSNTTSISNVKPVIAHSFAPPWDGIR